MKDRLIFRIAALILEGYREGEPPSEDIMAIIKGYSKGWSTLDYAPLPVEIISLSALWQSILQTAISHS